MKRSIALLLLLPAAVFAAGLPRVWLMHPEALAAARDSLARGDPGLEPALARLKSEADRALKLKPLSVTQKSKVPPSGDKHDYISQGPYWWPDPSKPNGLPYIRRDGEHNPEVDQGTDSGPWGRVSSAVSTLGLAYYFTGNEAYAEHAALLLRTWFLDPETRMNPNLNYGQFIPGITEGRGEGVLAFRALPGVCDALALMAGSPAWTAADDQAFRDWLSGYFTWLTESEVGRQEGAAANNHGSWYDVQESALALVLGRDALARKILVEALTRRVFHQVEPDGRQPLELARTKSLGYSLFNLQALTELGVLAERVGVNYWGTLDLWDEGRSLPMALRYHAPFVDPDKPWPKNDIVAGGRGELLPIMAEALRHRCDTQWSELLLRFGDAPSQRAARWRLTLDMPVKGST